MSTLGFEVILFELKSSATPKADIDASEKKVQMNGLPFKVLHNKFSCNELVGRKVDTEKCSLTPSQTSNNYCLGQMFTKALLTYIKFKLCRSTVDV